MDVPQISVGREKAEVEYQAYRTALKTKKDAFLHDLKVAYGHMRHGRAVLDVWQAFADQGVDAMGYPKLAIARADWPEAWCVRVNTGNGETERFQNERYNHHRRSASEVGTGMVTLPTGTLKRTLNAAGRLTYETLRTKTPIIPARFIPNSALSNYHVLWEPEKWDVYTPPRDPMLLKRINLNVFVVLAAWDMTDVERAVLRGRMA